VLVLIDHQPYQLANLNTRRSSRLGQAASPRGGPCRHDAGLVDRARATERDQVIRFPDEQPGGTTMIGPVAAGGARGRLAASVGADRPVASIEGAAANVLGFVTVGLAR
jgi:hypothetical protein